MESSGALLRGAGRAPPRRHRLHAAGPRRRVAPRKSDNNEAPTITFAKNDLEVPEICNNSDPRSPTPEIYWTPLQNKSTGKHNITKNVDLRKTFENGNGEEKLIHNNPILSAVIKNHLQSYDPRSPTQDFERTPIIISTKTDEDSCNCRNTAADCALALALAVHCRVLLTGCCCLQLLLLVAAAVAAAAAAAAAAVLTNKKRLLRQQSDNCASPVLNAETDDNYDSCAEACEKSPDLVVSRNLCEEFLNITLDDTLKEPQEPLGSSTPSYEALENNISSEDQHSHKPKFLETNFEYVDNEDKFEDSEENMNSIEDTDNMNEDDGSVFQVLDDDPRSPSIGIERTPIVVAKVDKDSNVETMSDDTLIKVLQSTNAELRQTGPKTDKNVDGLLIYEDEETNLNETPKKSYSASNSGSRTPLSCMKNKADVGHTRTKSANTVYDPKNQKIGSKIPKRVSHIPRLKCLYKQPNLVPAGSSVSLNNISKAVATGGDCENTPPHSHRDRWDKDNSIVL